jgi:hypothetical protein
MYNARTSKLEALRTVPPYTFAIWKYLATVLCTTCGHKRKVRTDQHVVSVFRLACHAALCLIEAYFFTF